MGVEAGYARQVLPSKEHEATMNLKTIFKANHIVFSAM